MKIFITGGTGFIGKHIVEKLKEDKDNELFLLSKNLADIINWKKEVEDFGPNATIHLAWEGLPDHSAKTSIKNLKYSLDLMNMLAEIGCKIFLSTGSCLEYGPQSGKLAEDISLKDLNAFTAAKNCLCQLGQEIAKENNTRFIWARLFYVYGPGQKEGSLIPYLINCAKNGKIPEIKNPLAKNDFIYVGDIAEALVLFLKKCKKSGVYNIGSGKLTGVSKIIEIVSNHFGIKKQYKNIKPKSTDTLHNNFYADIAKIKKEIGWEPKVGIQEGIKKTIDYYGK